MSVKSVPLFDAGGERIAFLANDVVTSLSGEAVGLHLRSLGIVTDLFGAYLGEIVLNDRLLSSNDVPANGPLRSQVARAGRATNVRPLRAAISSLPGYGDVPRTRLGLPAAAEAA